MTKLFSIVVLSFSCLLMIAGTAEAKGAAKGKSKAVTYTGIAVQVTKTNLVILVEGEKKAERHPVQLNNDTTYTGGELVQGAQVTVTCKGGLATNVDVAGPKT